VSNDSFTNNSDFFFKKDLEVEGGAVYLCRPFRIDGDVL
jgi:hypothetical protein